MLVINYRASIFDDLLSICDELKNSVLPAIGNLQKYDSGDYLLIETVVQPLIKHANSDLSHIISYGLDEKQTRTFISEAIIKLHLCWHRLTMKKNTVAKHLTPLIEKLLNLLPTEYPLQLELLTLEECGYSKTVQRPILACITEWMRVKLPQFEHRAAKEFQEWWYKQRPFKPSAPEEKPIQLTLDLESVTPRKNDSHEETMRKLAMYLDGEEHTDMGKTTETAAAPPGIGRGKYNPAALTLRQARRVAKVLDVRQKAAGKDLSLGALRAAISQQMNKVSDALIGQAFAAAGIG